MFYANRRTSFRPSRQQGIALVVVIVLSIAVFTLAAMAYRLATQATRAGSGWNDRQRALFYAENTIKTAEQNLDLFMYSNTDRSVILNTIANTSGYYVREAGNAPAHNPWGYVPGTSSKSAVLTQNFGSTKVEYFVVFEGESPHTQTGESFTDAHGTATQVLNPRRFTIYAKAPGAQKSTEVILSVTREYVD